MQEIFKILILSTTTITCWTAYLLLLDTRSNPLLNRWFAAFLLTLTASQFYLYSTFLVPYGYSYLGLVAFSTLWLKGPFMWVFVKVLVREEASLRTMWLHFLPCVIVLPTLLAFPESFNMCMLLGMCHALAYLLNCVRLLIKKRSYLIDIWQGFQNTSYYWLLYILIGLAVLIAVDLMMVSIAVTNGFDALEFFRFIVPLVSVYLLSIALLNVYRPALLFKHALVDDISVDETSEDTRVLASIILSPEQTIEQKERHLELNADLARALMSQLDGLMVEQQLYRQNELSLMDFASRLGITVHQVSELLNVHRGRSFYEYLNAYRLQYACDLLSDPSCQLRVLDIAFEAGFNNKNSFYRVFKETLGVTPNQYRSGILELKTA